MRFHSKMSAWFLSTLCVLLVVGCGSSDQPKTGEVSGVVTLDGSPFEGALVEFRPKSGGRSSVAHTDSQGGYELRYNANTPGAKVGLHSVSISYMRDSTVDDSGKVIEKGIPENFPKEFAEGTIEKEVKAGKNEFNFEAKSEKR